MSGGSVEICLFGIGKESVRPPYLAQHLIADAQFILAGVTEVQSVIGPVLPEIEFKSEVLPMSKA